MSPPRPLYYSDYLCLDKLLSAQELESAKRGKAVHDEHLFIVVHQAYELWFKQILFELDAVLALFRAPSIDERDMGKVEAHLRRIVSIERVLLGQIEVLETMTPLDFLDFRSLLVPASGFQSAQFRLLENRLGLPPEVRMTIEGAAYTSRLSDTDRKAVEQSVIEPSLLALVDRWLARTPFLQLGAYDFWREYERAVRATLERDKAQIRENAALTEPERTALLDRFRRTEANFETLLERGKHDELLRAGRRRLSHPALLAALLINLYRDEPILQLPFRLLQLLMDVDEGLTSWRHRHALMAWRMIGGKVGTGGTSGTDYLREAAERYKIFTDLFDLSTFFLPRSALPKLPPEVARKMSFQL
ncbi:MAG: tryptophan 2,3-dioxygenase family protein [Candidatus Eiseniibacteriota bacterium]